MRTSLKGHPVRSTFLQIYLSTQIEIFLAALMFYESCGKAAAIEGSEHATDTCTYVHTPPTVVGELVSAMADECGQPDRSMMHSRLISRCNFLFPALLRISPWRPQQNPPNPTPPPPTPPPAPPPPFLFYVAYRLFPPIFNAFCISGFASLFQCILHFVICQLFSMHFEIRDLPAY